MLIFTIFKSNHLSSFFNLFFIILFFESAIANVSQFFYELSRRKQRAPKPLNSVIPHLSALEVLNRGMRNPDNKINIL